MGLRMSKKRPGFIEMDLVSHDGRVCGEIISKHLM